MSGITSTGLVSGIDTASLIEQLLAVESRPRILMQSRIATLQTQQAAYLDINTRLSGLRTASAAFRVNNVFDARGATSSDEDTLTASASSAAQEGKYSFVVDRLVSTRQLLSRGFASADSGSFGASEFRFEGIEARLDRDTELAELNGGSGVRRGTIEITDRDGNSAEVDLSRVGTVNEVLEAINSTEGVNVRASVVDGSIQLTDQTSGSGTLSVQGVDGAFTAEDLGLTAAAAGATLTGSRVWSVTRNTSLSQLNDGRGVGFTDRAGEAASDILLDIDGVSIGVRLGEFSFDDDGDDETPNVEVPRATTLGEVIDRINEEIADEAAANGSFDGQVEARLAADGASIEIVDLSGTRTITATDGVRSTAARDLGLTGDGSGGTLAGDRLIAGLNSTLLSSLGGRDALELTGTLDFTTADGVTTNVDLSGLNSVSDLIERVRTETGGSVIASLDETGTGLAFADQTTGGTTFSVASGGGGDAVNQLSLSLDAGSGEIRSGNLQKAYFGEGVLLDSLNNGAGIGTGEIRITDSNGLGLTININDDVQTVGDIINQLNLALNDDPGAPTLRVEINENGDGIQVTDERGGTQNLTIEDVTGNVAEALGIEGEASGDGADNFIDGSLETVVTFEATDTLEDAVRKLNEAGAPATATILNDGSAGNAFRLSLTSRDAGRDGRFVFDTGGFDLGLQTLDEGEDARVFFGSSEPAQGVLLTSSSNTLDGAIRGVTIDLKQASDTPVEVTVSKSTAEVEAAMEELVSSFNAAIERIDFQTRFVAETEERGALIGDSTSITLRAKLFAAVQGPSNNVDGRYQRLTEIGVKFAGGGRLEFDRDAFREALATDPEAVEALLTEREVTSVGSASDADLPDGVTVSGGSDTTENFGAQGVPSLLEELVKSYTDSFDGLLTLRGNSLDTQIESQESRIEAFDLRLERRRTVLERQFLAMEQSIAQLQNQQAALGSLG
ncbi:MAG: flagellar filament capping protein FliD [Planctomycetota bacterium]